MALGEVHTLHTASTSLEQASRLATASISDAYARHTPMLSFDHSILFLLDDSITRTCSIAVGSSQYIVKPITTGEIGIEEPVCTSGLCVCVGVRTSEPSAEGKVDMLRATPLIVTRLRIDSRLGVGRESDGGNAATLLTSSRSGKGAPTGVGRC